MYTLVIIDMQAEFPAACNKSVISKIEKEIDKAISNNSPIVFLEYVGYKRTISKLFNRVDGYENSYFIRKYEDDGSKPLINLIKGFKLPKTLKVCGVNTDACVYKTVIGLTKNSSTLKIEVISKACWSDYSHENGLRYISEYKKIKIN